MSYTGEKNVVDLHNGTPYPEDEDIISINIPNLSETESIVLANISFNNILDIDDSVEGIVVPVITNGTLYLSLRLQVPPTLPTQSFTINFTHSFIR